jgi:hypothetical protein
MGAPLDAQAKMRVHEHQYPATVDGGSEFGQQFQKALQKSGINTTKVPTPYCPEANGMVEKDIKPSRILHCKENLLNCCQLTCSHASIT